MIKKKIKDTVTVLIKKLLALSPRFAIEVHFMRIFKKKLNLRNPTMLDEKIQWLKLYHYNKYPIYTYCADKLLVRDYVVKCECGHLLNDLMYTYSTANEINYDLLPNKFAIKWNFGNGLNFICTDKRNLDTNELSKTLNVWGRKNAYISSVEPQYRYINKKIIVEKYIESGDGLLPNDYKIFCFHGKPRYLFVCTERKNGSAKFYYFDREWNMLRITNDAKNVPSSFTVKKPPHLEEMFMAAEKLSAAFPFVRVDFYDTDEKLIFGELTFTPGGGFDSGRSFELQNELGLFLHLDDIKKYDEKLTTIFNEIW